MIIKYVKLTNIRSYINQTIKFPEGTILLSGDIGSGKSTILLAIEFALFGIKRGDLSGEALLRNGKNNGEVQLCFDIDNKEIIVNRKLKRTKSGIAQESGWIQIDGKRKDASPIEIKSDVLTLLGYPDELLTKGKDIIFRYTVYTPQEEMKQILLESKEARLDTLRKVFQIDRYKKIRENTLIYSRELKEKKREFEGRSSDLDEKKKKLIEEETLFNDKKSKLKIIEPKLKFAKEDLKIAKDKHFESETKVKRLNDLKKDFSGKEIDLINKVEQREKNKQEIETLTKEISAQNLDDLQKKIEEGKDISKIIALKKKEIEENRKLLMETKRQIADINARINNFKEIKDKITKLDKCPVCEQKVGEEHKHDISNREDEKITQLKAKLDISLKLEKESEKKILDLEIEIEKSRKQERELAILNVKWQNLQRDIDRQKRISDMQQRLKKEIGAINVAKGQLNLEIEKLKGVDLDFEKTKKLTEEIMEKEKRLEIEFSSIKKEVELREKIIEGLKKEIFDKEEAKKRIVKINQYINWLEEFFCNLMSTMERNVMVKVNNEFNEFFKQWFSMLIEDESMSVRIDDEFTPIIEQNGYETELVNLSGGEKTSCALAYRLALNKVINDMVGSIKTKDLIILDEPTDGFSSEQLDRVREVIEQIGMKQIVIVSHEEKIESFVNHIIRVEKKEHVSEINS